MSSIYYVRANLRANLKIRFEAEKGEPMTRGYPGSPDYLEVLSFSYKGRLLPEWFFQAIMEDLADEIEEICQDSLIDQLSSDTASIAEARCEGDR